MSAVTAAAVTAAAVTLNPHISNLIEDTFEAKPEVISNVLQWHAAYKEKVKEKNRLYYGKMKNDPDMKEKQFNNIRKWQENNRPAIAARHKARYENDPEYRTKLLEYRRKYYEKNKK
jgi:hypothetical protein